MGCDSLRSLCAGPTTLRGQDTLRCPVDTTECSFLQAGDQSGDVFLQARYVRSHGFIRLQRRATPFGTLRLALASALSPGPRGGGGHGTRLNFLFLIILAGLHSQPSGGFQRKLAELCAADVARGLWKTALVLKTVRTSGLNALIQYASEATGTNETEKGRGHQG